MPKFAKIPAVTLAALLVAGLVSFDAFVKPTKASSAGCDAFVVYSYDYVKGASRQSICLMNGQTFSPPAYYLQPVLIGVITGPGASAIGQISKFAHNSVNDYVQMGFSNEFAAGTAHTYPLTGKVVGATFLNSIVVHANCAMMVNSSYSVNGPISSVCIPPNQSVTLPKVKGMYPTLLDVFVVSKKSTCRVTAIVRDYIWANRSNAGTLSIYAPHAIVVNSPSIAATANGMYWTELNVTRNSLTGVFVQSFSASGPC